ncbi:hypothetical protein Tco_1426072, partial [Tanacetum coccineum]
VADSVALFSRAPFTLLALYSLLPHYLIKVHKQNLLGKATKANNTNSFNTVSTSVNTASASRAYNDAGPSAFDDEDLDTYNSPFADQVMGAEADFNNMGPLTVVSPITTTRIHSIHSKEPTKIAQALDDESWVEAMQEELL